MVRSCLAETTPTENGSAVSNSKQSEEENIAHTTSNEKTMMSRAITHPDVEVKMEICNNPILSNIMVGKPGKPQSHKTEVLCLVLNCTSPCTNPLSKLH